MEKNLGMIILLVLLVCILWGLGLKLRVYFALKKMAKGFIGFLTPPKVSWLSLQTESPKDSPKRESTLRQWLLASLLNLKMALWPSK